jgi:hypothetical protein
MYFISHRAQASRDVPQHAPGLRPATPPQPPPGRREERGCQDLGVCQGLQVNEECL